MSKTRVWSSACPYKVTVTYRGPNWKFLRAFFSFQWKKTLYLNKHYKYEDNHIIFKKPIGTRRNTGYTFHYHDKYEESKGAKREQRIANH